MSLVLLPNDLVYETACAHPTGCGIIGPGLEEDFMRFQNVDLSALVRFYHHICLDWMPEHPRGRGQATTLL